jgi:hypothetical protein
MGAPSRRRILRERLGFRRSLEAPAGWPAFLFACFDLTSAGGRTAGSCGRQGGGDRRRHRRGGEKESDSQERDSYLRAMPLFLFEPDQRRFVRAFGAFVLVCAWFAAR